jgi:hypothetical protein
MEDLQSPRIQACADAEALTVYSAMDTHTLPSGRIVTVTYSDLLEVLRDCYIRGRAAERQDFADEMARR